MSHTPGPWHTAIASGSIVVWSTDGVPYIQVARIPNKGYPDIAQHNARLIAAAPELLAALQQIADIENDPRANSSFEEISEARIIARAAIARATGAEPC